MPSQFDDVVAVLSGKKEISVGISPRAAATLFAVVFGATLLALIIAFALFNRKRNG